jgi:hypothetical protein
MRFTLAVPIGVLGFVCLASTASAQGSRASIQGFGGLRLGGFTSTDTAFGAVVTADLTPNIQVVGEGGRIGNLLPPTVDLLFGIIPGGIGASTSAWYGQGGVRLTAATSGVRPYAETSAGIARLQTRVSGLGGTTGALTNVALQFLDRTSPIATVGAGVIFAAGPIVTDLGYRYRRILSNDWTTALSFGQQLDSSEVRVGVGVRF